MRDLIVISIILLILLYNAIRDINPCIDIIHVGPKHYKVLLWYNSLKKERKWVKIFEYKRKVK